MKTDRRAATLAFLSLVLAAVASVLLLFLPFYSGFSLNPTTWEPISGSATLIQINGFWVLIPLAVPLILSGAGWLARQSITQSWRGRRLVLWASAVLLLIFVVITGFSIGMFYAPSALLLLASAMLRGNTESTSAR